MIDDSLREGIVTQCYPAAFKDPKMEPPQRISITRLGNLRDYGYVPFFLGSFREFGSPAFPKTGCLQGRPENRDAAFFSLLLLV